MHTSARSAYGAGVTSGTPTVIRAGATAHTAASWSHPDMARWVPFRGSPDADLLPEQGTIVARSRDLERNHGVAAGALQRQVDNIIGVGMWLQPTPAHKLLGRSKEWADAWADDVQGKFRLWSETAACDAGRSLTLDGLAEQLFRGAWLNGDGLALPLWMPERFALAATRLQVIEADRMSNPRGMPDTATLRGGVEIDTYGAPKACWVRKTHPGDRWFGMMGDVGEWERIPFFTPWGRRRVLHVHQKDRAGLTRGRPALTAIMREFKVLGDYKNAEVKSALVNAMVAAITETNMAPEAVAQLFMDDNEFRASLSNRDLHQVNFQAGMVLPLQPGEKFSGFTPTRPASAFAPFVESVFRHMSAGLNMPYELLMLDFSKTNYSSARAALMEAWRFFAGRRKWIALGFYQPAYELWLEEQINAGQIEAPDFYQNRAAWCQASWIGPGRGWIDPVKEGLASEIRMKIGVSTLRDECAEQGKDWREVLEQLATERAYRARLGLPEPAVTATTATALTQEEPAGDADNKQEGKDANA